MESVLSVTSARLKMKLSGLFISTNHFQKHLIVPYVQEKVSLEIKFILSARKHSIVRRQREIISIRYYLGSKFKPLPIKTEVPVLWLSCVSRTTDNKGGGGGGFGNGGRLQVLW